ncbi:acylneuraminate cytidylyltransferase family protein [Aquimarina agarilytica]|uniref:acylneuraminate cytidylyltransferase family protein n=1 Tax=Aquimarina agarilytica TaxID=1087449 RepID=UPI00028817BA|nr:acylneuraminate cytidylyltransferase family protein [Aquimarina agarilytica]
MNILITICARGGSKGIPRKNIKEIAGKPLIYYSLNLAEKLKKERPSDIIDIVLSTDSDEIKEVVRRFQIEDLYLEYIRPAKLATDKSGKLDAIIDVRDHMEKNKNIIYDYVLDLDVSSPLRTIEDLKKAFAIIISDDEAFNIFSVNVAHKNPYFNMVEKLDNGYYSLCKKGNFLTRQSAPDVYEMNASFYIYNKTFFKQKLKSVITEKSLIYEMDHICFDLDNPIDFDFMEYLIENNKLGIEL